MTTNNLLDNELIELFKVKNKDIKITIKNLLEEADKIASNKIPATSLEDIFEKDN